MDKRIAGVVGAISGLAALDAAQAAAVDAQPTLPPANSFADLLDPIPNAVALLRAINAVDVSGPATQASDEPQVQLAGYHHHHHRWRHHHHHHRVFIYRHHHHHHHRVFRHHHHHHHHHRSGY